MATGKATKVGDLLDYVVLRMPRGARCVPCPWCASANFLEMQAGKLCHFWLQCRNQNSNEDGCYASGPVGNSREEAVENWNRRAPSPVKKG